MPLLPASWMAKIPKAMTSGITPGVSRGLQSGAGYGAAAGGALGGMHGAFTDDPNNPYEGRMGRILSHAAGGTMLGAGAGAGIGGGHAHVQDMIGTARNQGRMQGGIAGAALGGLAGGLGGSNVAAGAMGRARQAGKNIVEKFKGGPASEAGKIQAMGAAGRARSAQYGTPVNQTAVNKSVARKQSRAAQTAGGTLKAQRPVVGTPSIEKQWYPLGAPGEYGKTGSSDFWTGFMGRTYGE